MSEILVHSIPGSPFGRAVLATLEEKGANYRLVPVAPGAFRSEAHLARHPFGRVPVLEHDGFRLYETQAILRYLDRALSGPPLTPPDPREAARMDQAMSVNDWYLFQGVANIIVFHRIISQRVLGGIPDEAAINAAIPKAMVVLAEISRLLGDQAFIAGDQFTLADLHLAPQIALMAETPEWSTLTANVPNITAWLAMVETRPCMVATRWEYVSERAKAAHHAH